MTTARAAGLFGVYLNRFSVVIADSVKSEAWTCHAASSSIWWRSTSAAALLAAAAAAAVAAAAAAAAAP